MGLLQTIEQDAVAGVEAAWAAVKPKIQALDATVVASMAQAAETLVSSGFSAQGLADATTAVMAAVASDLGVLEQDVAAGIAVFANSIISDVTAAPTPLAAA